MIIISALWANTGNEPSKMFLKQDIKFKLTSKSEVLCSWEDSIIYVQHVI